MKRFISFSLAMIMVLTLTACGKKSSKEDEPEDSSVEETTEETTTKETTTATTTTEETTTNIIDSAPVLVVGDSISIEDVCDFSIEYIDITDKVVPPEADGWYSYYEAEEGKTYVDLCLAYKNTATTDIVADDAVLGMLIYAGKYEYRGFSIIEEDSRSDFTYSNITSIAPLSTEYIHYLFTIPDEVNDASESIELIICVGDDFYKIIVREGSDEVTEAPQDSANRKTSGEVSLEEVITTSNAEFSIDYVDITNDVEPPHPDSWYSHYEADSGKVYVDICISYKNTAFTYVMADEVFSGTLKYAGKYEYKGFSIIEESNRGDFTYSSITSIDPLTTEYLHYLFEVPEEVKDSSESVVITFIVDGNTYTYTVR